MPCYIINRLTRFVVNNLTPMQHYRMSVHARIYPFEVRIKHVDEASSLIYAAIDVPIKNLQQSARPTNILIANL